MKSDLIIKRASDLFKHFQEKRISETEYLEQKKQLFSLYENRLKRMEEAKKIELQISELRLQFYKGDIKEEEFNQSINPLIAEHKDLLQLNLFEE